MLRPATARYRLRNSVATPDRTLVERMSRGDEAAFRDLLARYRSTLYATAYAALADPEQVDATVADAFVEARRTATAFLQSLGTVSGWLTHLTRLCIAARLATSRRPT
jgi:DNA-directed RNA polymerase specialized sigma24 family protein